MPLCPPAQELPGEPFSCSWSLHSWSTETVLAFPSFQTSVTNGKWAKEERVGLCFPPKHIRDFSRRALVMREAHAPSLSGLDFAAWVLVTGVCTARLQQPVRPYSW